MSEWLAPATQLLFCAFARVRLRTTTASAAPTKTRSGGDRARSAYCSLISSSRRPVALAPSHAPRAPHPAVCAMLCDRTQQFAPQHLCSWLCANPGPQHCSTTRTTRALLRCRCMIGPSALSSQPSCPPPLHSAPCATPTGTTSPVMWLPGCGVRTTTCQFPPVCCAGADGMSMHVVHPPQALLMAATATHHALPILIHRNALLHTATPQCRFVHYSLGVPQLRLRLACHS